MNELNGKWNITVHTYMGDMRSQLEVTVEGDQLVGQCTDSSNGAVANVDNGRVEGSKFSYSITIKTPVGEMTNDLSGELVDGMLRGKSKNAMGEFDFDATRA